MIYDVYLVQLNRDELLTVLSGLITLKVCVRDRAVPEFDTEEQRIECLAEITTAINTLYDSFVN